MRFKHGVAIVSLLALALLGWAAPAAAEPMKIRVGWVTTPSNPLPLVWQKTGIMKYFGKTSTVELTKFKGTPLVVQAFAAKALEFGALSYAALANAVTRSNLDLRGHRWLFDPKNRDEMLDMAARYTKRPERLYR